MSESLKGFKTDRTNVALFTEHTVPYSEHAQTGKKEKVVGL